MEKCPPPVGRGGLLEEVAVSCSHIPGFVLRSASAVGCPECASFARRIRSVTFECASLCPGLTEVVSRISEAASRYSAAAKKQLPTTVLNSVPEELANDAREAGEEVRDSVEEAAGAIRSTAAGAVFAVKKAARRAKKAARKSVEGITDVVGPPEMPDMPELPPVKQFPYAFATYVTILMIYVFGLALLPYACTHQVDKLFWPLLTLFLTGVTSVLLRTQLMIRVVPETARSPSKYVEGQTG